VVQIMTRQVTTVSYAWYGGVFAGVAAAQLLSTVLWGRQGGTHIVWFPGAVLLAFLLGAPSRTWPICLLSALLGVLLVEIGFRIPATDTVLSTLPPLLFAGVAARLLLMVRGEASPLEDFGKLAAFALVAVVALPAVSATAIGFARGESSDWANIALAHALGYALYVPVWISVRCPHAAVRHAAHVPWGFVGVEMVMLSFLAVFWYLLGDRVALRPLLCLAPAPIIISACVRTQMTGSSMMVFVIVILAAQLSVWGKGPFIAETQQHTTLALQLWTLAVSLSALTLSVVVEQRASARRDLTVAHHDLREMAGRLIATMEQERARLARDLHDDINQRLAASSIGLSALRRCVGPKFRDDVTSIQSDIVALSEDVRHLSHSLHPSSVVHAGLRNALESLCSGQRRAKGPRIFLVADRRADELPPEAALCFYRIAQEALTNALRHAVAKKITIRLSVAADQASLWVFDDGVGFDTTSSTSCRSGIGLISMQERTRLLGGSFDLRSAPGRGVDLCIRIPLATS